MENLTVNELKKQCKSLNIKLTKTDGSLKLKKDLIKSLKLNQKSIIGGRKNSKRKSSKRKSSKRKSSKRKSSKRKSSKRKSSKRKSSKRTSSKRKSSKNKIKNTVHIGGGDYKSMYKMYNEHFNIHTAVN